MRRNPKLIGVVANVSDDVVQVLREHVLAHDSLDDAIRELEQRSRSMPVLYLPGGRRLETREAVSVLKSWLPQALPRTSTIDVFYATDGKTASRMEREGIIPALKPTNLAMLRFERGEPAEFAPGRGISRGVYVGATPEEVSGYGRTILRLRVPRSWLEVPPEQEVLGVTDPIAALKTVDGAVVNRPIPASAVEILVKQNASKRRYLYALHRRSGLWETLRDVLPETEQQWVEVFKKDPDVRQKYAYLIVSSSKPRWTSRSAKIPSSAISMDDLTENPSVDVDAVFDESFDVVEDQFPDFGTVEFYEDERAGTDNGAGSKRQFAYCQDGNPIAIAFAPKAAGLPRAQLVGLMRHEFGHALEYRYGVQELERRLGVRLPSQVERRADRIAEAVWGEPIVYDADFVQCVGVHGQRPRPAHLPDKREVLRPNPAGDDAILPKGSLLFHGTIEPFESDLAPGIDGVLWFSDSPGIAQLYIPCSGMSLFTSPELLAKPKNDAGVQAVQRYIGIHYDYDDVDWDPRNPTRAIAWPRPEGFDGLPTPKDVEELLEKAGFVIDRTRYNPSVQIDVYRDQNGDLQVLPPGDCREGRLFIATPTRDMRIYVMAKGEGDLMDTQYTKYDDFRDLEDEGYDGVLIDDFAQSREWGNLGHLSIGLFEEATRDLIVESRVARYREWDGDDSTPEYPDPVTEFLGRMRRGLDV